MNREDSGRTAVSLGTRGTARDTLARIVVNVPALREAGLDDVAESVLRMAREAETRPEPPAAATAVEARPKRRGRSLPPRPRSVEPAQDALPEPEPVETVEVPPRQRSWRPAVGGVLLLAIAGLGHGRSRARHGVAFLRYLASRRRDLVLGTVAVSTMSLLVGWVITRLP